MKAKLDIKTIQALNLFERITRVKAQYCFYYNNALVFTVSPFFIRQINREHLNRLGRQLNTYIKIIPSPNETNNYEICKFVRALINYPYKKVILQDKEVIFFIHSPKTKSVFLGKDKIRLKQLTEALKQFFDVEKVSVR